jgi:hypothetical protein
MNQGQEMFYNFFIERAKDDKKEEAKKLLMEGFVRQEEGTFDKEYLQNIMPQYFDLIKPEAVDELKQAMQHFASRL